MIRRGAQIDGSRRVGRLITVCGAGPGTIRCLIRTASKLLACAAISIVIQVNIVSGASESCHIHPPGWESKEPEYRDLQFYASLPECESANARYYGGRGRCHCIPDVFFNRDRRDSWFVPPDYFAPPRERLY